MKGEIISDITEEVMDTTEEVSKTFSKQTHASERQKTDMLSDSQLSKCIRPIIAIWSMFLLSLYLILSACNITIPEDVGETIFWLTVIVMGFYFPGRTVEKWASRKRK